LFGGVGNPGGSLKRSLGMAPLPSFRAQLSEVEGKAVTTARRKSRYRQYSRFLLEDLPADMKKGLQAAGLLAFKTLRCGVLTTL